MQSCFFKSFAQVQNIVMARLFASFWLEREKITLTITWPEVEVNNVN